MECFNPFYEKIHSYKRRKISRSISLKLMEAGISSTSDDVICDSCRLKVSSHKTSTVDDNNVMNFESVETEAVDNDSDCSREEGSDIDEVCITINSLHFFLSL